MTGDLGGTSAEALLRAAMDAMVDPQALLEAVRDHDGRIVDFVCRELNPAAGTFLGAAREELIGDSLTKTLPDIAGSGWLARLVHCLETGEALSVEDYPYSTRDTVRRYDVRAARTTPNWLSVVWRDVTERYDAQQREQVEADIRFRLLIENSAIATNLLTPDGRFLVVNPAMCELVGYDADTLLKMTWRDLATPEDMTATIRAVVEIAQGRRDSYRINRQYIHADGHRIWGALTISCIRNSAGVIEHLIAQIIDITEQVELRAKQAEADARFRRLMETSNVAMALVAPDGTLDVVNQALCELFGYDEETLKTKTWQQLTPERYLEADLKSTEDLLAGRVDTYRVTKQHIHADGHLIWVDLSVSCLRDTAGEVQYLVAQGVDMSEAIEAQEQLAQREQENRLLADRLQAEMLNAAEYVESILPRDMTGPVQVSSRYLPSSDLGGDCFHYRWLDDDHLEMYLIDVSGHGVRPAFLSVSVHNLIRSGSLPATVLLNPDRVLDAVNGLFPMEDQAGSYSTIWFGIYQRSTRELRYASAGHPPALALVRDGDRVTAEGLYTPAWPIGMFDDTVYPCESYVVPAGGQLLLYSDGAFDLPVRNAAGKPWSRADFVDLCTELAARPDWSLDDLITRLRALSPTGAFDDDCALVLFTFP